MGVKLLFLHAAVLALLHTGYCAVPIVEISNTAVAGLGDKVIITCNYVKQDGKTQTIVWKHDNADLTADQKAQETEGDPCMNQATGDVTIRYRYVIAAAAVTDAGDYVCIVTTDSTPEASVAVKLNIRSISLPTVTQYAGHTGDALAVTCTITGDAPASVAWVTSAGDAITTLTGATSTEDGGKMGANLAIAALGPTHDEQTVKCLATWSSLTPTTLETSIQIFALDLPGIAGAATETLSPGAKLTITCNYERSSELMEYKLLKNGQEIASKDLRQDTVSEGSEYEIASLTPADNGVYSCKIEYSWGIFTGKASKTVFVRGASADATTYVNTDTSTVVLSCDFYGDALEAAAWKVQGESTNIATVASATTVDPGTYDPATSTLTTTLTIITVQSSDAKVYECSATYTDGGTATSSLQTLSVIANSGVTASSAPMVDLGGSVTLTCTHTVPPPDVNALIVKWYRSGTELSADNVAYPSTTTSTYTIAAAGAGDNGQYSTQLVFSDPHKYPSLNSGEVSQYVRDLAAGTPETFAVDGAAEITLSCIFRGDVSTLAPTWAKAGVVNDLAQGDGADYEITVVDSSQFEKVAKLKIKTLVDGDAAVYTCKATFGSDSDTTDKSTTQTLTVLGIASLVSSSDRIDAFGAFTLTCTHSASSATLAITWTRNSEPVTSGITAEGSTKSILTVASAEKTDNGVYKCEVKFGSYGTTAKEISQYVRFADYSGVNYAIDGAATYALTCTFYGDALSATSWKYGSTALADDDDYDIGTTTLDNFSRKDTLTINGVETANDGRYVCTATYTEGSANMEKELRINVIETSLTSSASTVDSGEGFILTCKFTLLSDVTPTVQWVKDSEELTGLTTATTADSDYTSITYTVAASATDNDGVYKCKVTFGDHGTGESAELTQYVRYVTPSATIYGVLDGNVDIVCKFYGDALTGATTWYKDDASSAIADGAPYTITAGSYADLSRTDTLTISSLEAANAGKYTCKATYTAGTQEITSDQTLVATSEALAVAVTRTPADAVMASEGTTVTFTCTYTTKVMGNGEGDISVSWTVNDGPITVTPTDAAGSQTFSLTTTAVNSGQYKCIVTYGVFGEISGTNDLKIRAVILGTAVNALQGAQTVITCLVYGDAPASITWKIGDAGPDETNTAATVTDEAHTGYMTKSTYTIASPQATSAYTCTAVWSAGTAKTEPKSGALTIITSAKPTVSFVPSAIPDAGTQDVIKCTFASRTATAIPDSEVVTVTILKDTSSEVMKEIIPSTSDQAKQITIIEHTIASVATSDSGSYSCTVQLGTFGTLTTDAPGVLQVRAHTADSTTVTTAGTATTLSCVFEGDTLTYTSWVKEGVTDPLVTGSGITIDQGTYQSASGLTTTLTLDTLSADAKYTCTATYTAGSTAATTVFTLTVLGISSLNYGSNNNIAAEGTIAVGDEGVLDCTWTISSDVSITVEWSKDAQTIATGDEYTIDSSAEASGTSKMTIPAAKATSAKSGEYKCKVTFGDKGSNEAVKTIYYEEVTVGAAATFTSLSDTVTLTCTFNGKLTDTTTEWFKDSSSSAIGTDSSYTVTGGSIDGYSRVDKLVIKAVDALDSATYKCKAGSLEATQTLDVIAIATNPVNAVAEADKTTSLSCVTSDTKLVITTVDWYNGETKVADDDSAITSAAGDSSGFNKYTSTLTITGSVSVSSGSYSCVVSVPGGQDSDQVKSTAATFSRIGVSTSNVSGYTGDYIESDGASADYSEQYTINFYVFKGPGIASVTGKFTDADSAETVVVFTAGDEADVGEGEGATGEKIVPYSYTPAYADQKTGTFSVEIVYTGFADDTVTAQKAVTIHQYCKSSSLTSVSKGTWSPATKVDYSSYATLTCETGYFVTGQSTAKCETAGAFDLDTDTPACASSTGRVCGDLPTVTKGSVNYINESYAKYECEDGYALLGAEEIYSCDSTTEKWSIYTASNPSGTAPTCEDAAAADARSIEFTVEFATETEYCKDAGEKTKVETALTTFLKTDSVSKCLTNEQCVMESFECTWDDNTLTVKFTLKQTAMLDEASVVTDDAATIAATTIVLSIDNGSKRKRRALDLNSGTVASSSTTSCPADYIVHDDSCVQCPPGYGLVDSACGACSTGYYSTTTDIAACTQCTTGTTTMSSGSTLATDCVDSTTLCTVPAAPENGGLTPPPGTLVVTGGTVTVTCGDGYAVEYNMPSSFTCSGDNLKAPACYLQCDVSSLTEAAVESFHIDWNTVKNISKLSHEQEVYVACEDGYETECKKNYDFYRCIGNKGAAMSSTKIHECIKKPIIINILLIIVIVLAAVIVLLLVGCTWCIKRARKHRKGLTAPVRMPRGAPVPEVYSNDPRPGGAARGGGALPLGDQIAMQEGHW